LRHGLEETKKFEIDLSRLVDPFRRLKKQYKKKKKKDLMAEDIAMQS
jgi:Zn-finger nucleic acid-binding protein